MSSWNAKAEDIISDFYSHAVEDYGEIHLDVDRVKQLEQAIAGALQNAYDDGYSEGMGY